MPSPPPLGSIQQKQHAHNKTNPWQTLASMLWKTTKWGLCCLKKGGGAHGGDRSCALFGFWMRPWSHWTTICQRPFFSKKSLSALTIFFSKEEHLFRIVGNLVDAGFLGFWKGAPPLESGNSNVILARQSCSQRSGIMMAAASKRRALTFDVTVRMQSIFLMSK